MRPWTLILLLNLSSSLIVHAQGTGCYKTLHDLGWKYYKEKNYKEAIEVWENAKKCSDKPEKNDLLNLIDLAKLEDNMVQVKGGNFTMGCTSGDPNCFSKENPTRTVTLSAFQISKTEVTQDLWQKVMGSNPSSFPNCPQCPVETVSWYDALVFCNRLSELHEFTPCYYWDNNRNQVYGKKSDGTWGLPNSGEIYWDRKANGYRLPTEAEWEYAARGSNSTHIYSGSNEVNAVAWYKPESGNTTKPVKGKRPNGFGLYDMSGNIWEWCWDWFKTYPSSAQTNPVGPSSGSHRVGRGGSWGVSPTDVRVAYRGDDAPGDRSYYAGFRLARAQ